MKVYIGNYRDHWVSPYTICELICFWREIDNDEPWVKRMNSILEPVCKAWQSILDFVHPRISYVKIDKYDTWSMDSTLSLIILPMLKQLQREKQGAPNTDDADVPEHLRSTSASEKENEWDTDDNHFKRWDWILSEMIWAFEQVCNPDNDKQFWIEPGEIDWDAGEPDERGLTAIKWKKESKVDYDGLQQHHDRIQAGLTLFGKYYRNLWD